MIKCQKGLQCTTLLISYDRKMEKKIVDYEGVFDLLITELQKTFYGILHDIIIAKLELYGIQMDA